MSTTTIGIDVQKYLDAVRAHLDDLPPDDRDELLEDLEEHLVEVAAEDDGTLEHRLGPPARYAEELRASAGLPGRGESSGQNVIERLMRSRPARFAATGLDSAQWRAFRGFLREVEPGWWALRGYLAVLVPVIITSGNSVRENVPYPQLFGSYAVGITMIPLAIWVSWRLGRRARRDRGAGILSLAFTAAVVVAAIGAFGGWQTGGYPYAYADEGSGYGVETPYLHHPDGTPIANICPYSSDGKLLSGVLLFDHGGRAITNTAESIDGANPIEQSQPAILNAYPRAINVIDHQSPTMTQVPLLCPASVAAQPSPSSPVAPTPIPTTGD